MKYVEGFQQHRHNELQPYLAGVFGTGVFQEEYKTVNVLGEPTKLKVKRLFINQITFVNKHTHQSPSKLIG